MKIEMVLILTWLRTYTPIACGVCVCARARARSWGWATQPVATCARERVRAHHGRATASMARSAPLAWSCGATARLRWQ